MVTTEPLTLLEPTFVSGQLKPSVVITAVFNLLPGPLNDRIYWPQLMRSSGKCSSQASSPAITSIEKGEMGLRASSK